MRKYFLEMFCVKWIVQSIVAQEGTNILMFCVFEYGAEYGAECSAESGAKWYFMEVNHGHIKLW